MEALLDYQKKFEADPNNVDNAFYYFRELNRNGKFQTVVRLYAKYELPYAYNSNHRFYEKVKQQYTYAQENLESIRRAGGWEASG